MAQPLRHRQGGVGRVGAPPFVIADRRGGDPWPTLAPAATFVPGLPRRFAPRNDE